MKAWQGLLAFVVASFAWSCGVSGDLVREPVDDWSFMAETEGVRFETAGGAGFGMGAGPIVLDGSLYLQVSTIFEQDVEGVGALEAGDTVRMQVGDDVYPLVATPLTTAADVQHLVPVLLRRSGIDATGARWDPDPERYPGTQIRQWFYRLESERVP